MTKTIMTKRKIETLFVVKLAVSAVLETSVVEKQIFLAAGDGVFFVSMLWLDAGGKAVCVWVCLIYP